MSDTPRDGQATGFEIAVIGMAGRFPQARDLGAFWRNIRDGVDCLSTFSDEQLLASGWERTLLSDPRLVRSGGVLDDAELFDAAFFGIPPRDAELLDPQHRFFLECAWEALETAGYDPEAYKGRIGVFAGAGRNTYLLLHLLGQDPEALGLVNALANDSDYLTTRVSYKLNLRGPSVDVQTACSTSLVAVHLACQNLLVGECEMALAGGIALRVPQEAGYFYQEGGNLSPDGLCRAFDARAGGMVGANGVGIVVLKRLADALADGDTIRAVIRGSAINNDGSGKVGFTAPSVDGQAEAIRRALELADVEPDTIGYVEAHGTGTSLGDPIEIAGLTQAYRSRTDRKGYCAIGSLKASIGHTDTAAGVAGLIKTVLALQHGVLPPSLHFERPNPNIDFENSPFYVNTSLRPWPKGKTPRRAGVSSFGLGGTNAHAVLEEAPAPPAPSESRSLQLLLLSARSRAALQNVTARLCDLFRQQGQLAPADVAYTLQVGRRRFAHRRYLVCRDLPEAAGLLESFVPGRVATERVDVEGVEGDALRMEILEGVDPKRVVTGVDESRERPVAFMFPGQGAQHVEMGRDLYDGEAVFRESLDRCAELLEPHLGRDLRRVLYPAEAERAKASEDLRQTGMTQPALFAVEYALSQLWMSWGIRPVAMIGHSIGEYVAACLAGVFQLEDALWLVSERGRLMQGLPAGSMLAVRLPASELEGLLEGGVGIAALNEDAATVVSGPTESVLRLEGRLAQRGVGCQRLHTSHAFHSAMMDPVLAEFEQRVARVPRQAPRIPYVSNLTGTWVTAAEAVDPGYWSRHLRQPVRFGQGLKELLSDPERALLEVGPGRTLSGLAGRLAGRKAKNPVLSSMRHPNESQSDVAFLLGALGRLWLAGVEVDWRAFHGPAPRRRVPLPTYPFERQRFWVERAKGDVLGVRRDRNKRADVGQWFYLPSWKRSPAPATSAGRRGPWLVFSDASGLGERLVRRLSQAGHDVVSVVPADAFGERGPGVHGLNSLEPGDYTKLLDALAAQGRSPVSVVHLWNLDDEPRRFQERGFFSLLYLGRALGSRASEEGREIVVVSSGTQDVTGAEPLSPEKATVLGPCKVIPQEYPGLVCRSVDLVAPGTAGWDELSVARIFEEATSGSDDRAVAYRGGRRWVQGHEPWPLPAVEGRPARLRERGVYLVTGGLGGIGLDVAESLARDARARLVLVGRGALPPRSEWEGRIAKGDGGELGLRLKRLRALEELGAEVLTLQADAADLAQMKKVVEQAEARFGALHGAFHAVGVERAFQSIAETGSAEAEAQFRPRLQATAVLEQALDGRPLDFCLLISSLSSVLGGRGSVAYTAAHVFLDAFAARHNRRSPVPWLSVNWDRWNTWREAPEQPQEGEAGFYMAPGEAVDALRRVLAQDQATQVVVSTGDLLGRIERWIQFVEHEKPEEVRTGRNALYARPELAEEFVAPSTETEKLLAGIWCEALGLESVGVNDDYFELGGDSVIGLRIVARANESGLRMTGRHIFEHHTIGGLAAALGAPAPPPQAAPETPKPEPAAEEAAAFPGARLDRKDLEAFLAQFDNRPGGAPK